MISRERKAIESTYTDTCSIFYHNKVKENGITKNQRLVVLEGVACALSQKAPSSASPTGMANEIKYDAKLFLAPEIEIKPGCDIEVTQQGRLLRFISSGEPPVYETHQEVILLRKDKA